EKLVPSPLTMPVTVVDSVMSGVVVGLMTVPARPWASVIETLVTLPALFTSAAMPPVVVRDVVNVPSPLGESTGTTSLPDSAGSAGRSVKRTSAMGYLVGRRALVGAVLGHEALTALRDEKLAGLCRDPVAVIDLEIFRPRIEHRERVGRQDARLELWLWDIVATVTDEEPDVLQIGAGELELPS